MASQALERQSAYQNVVGFLQGEAQLAKLANAMPRIPGHGMAQHMTRVQRAASVAMMAIRSSPKLLECPFESIRDSVIRAYQLGLELDGAMGQGYLIPRKTKGQLLCRMEVGYKGYIALAHRSGLVKSVSAAVVYDCDEFEYRRGSDPMIRHVQDLAALEPGPEKCAWAIAYLTDGGCQWEVIGARRIAKAERASRAGDYGPWKTDREAMVQKTAIRELAKFMPQCPEMMREAFNDTYSEAGLPPPPVPALEDFPGTIDVGEETNDGQSA